MTSNTENPYDENADVLQNMAASGVDLVQPRVIDFEHCFPDKASAEQFQAAVANSVLSATLFEADETLDGSWGVQCKVRMTPTCASITDTEQRLAGLAEQLGGQPDGWGSMSNPDGSPLE